MEKTRKSADNDNYAVVVVLGTVFGNVTYVMYGDRPYCEHSEHDPNVT